VDAIAQGIYLCRVSRLGEAAFRDDLSFLILDSGQELVAGVDGHLPWTHAVDWVQSLETEVMADLKGG
jgi:hypothetical protein